MKIDKQAFHDRLLHFVSAWKADKRSNDALFGGVGSIVLLMGKNEGNITFQKNNAMHVCTRLKAPYNCQGLTEMILYSFGFLDTSFLQRLWSLPRKRFTS